MDSYSGSNYGTLLVTIGDITGSICADGFTDREANAACRDLGYSGGVIYKNPGTHVSTCSILHDKQAMVRSLI